MSFFLQEKGRPTVAEPCIQQIRPFLPFRSPSVQKLHPLASLPLGERPALVFLPLASVADGGYGAMSLSAGKHQYRLSQERRESIPGRPVFQSHSHQWVEVQLVFAKAAEAQRPHTSGRCSDALFPEGGFHGSWPVVAGERATLIVTEMGLSRIETAPNC